MSGSGTDKTKSGIELTGPIVILVEPQLGENIGMAARAMGNFGLTRLTHRQPARRLAQCACGARRLRRRPYPRPGRTVRHRRAGGRRLHVPARHHRPRPRPGQAGGRARRPPPGRSSAEIGGGGTAGILFGRERYGLKNEEVALADRIVTFPVNPGFASLNLAQAVLLMGYEWFKLSTAGALPFAMPERSERASQHQMQAFFDNLVRELDKVEFLRPAEKRETMLVNLRNIFTRMEPTKQDMHTLHGVVMAIAEGRKGPAKGGVLDGEQATRLRALLAEHGQGALPSESGTVRGIARLLRRNPTDAERILWQALTTDRRFAGQFKRQTPVGRHIPDFVSFVHRVAIELINPGETEAIVSDRATRQAWLEARGYRVIAMPVADVEADLAGQLDRLETRLLKDHS